MAAEFEDLVKVGLRQLILDEGNLQLVAADVPLADLSDVIEEHSPAVALLNFGSLPSPATVHQLHERHPGTRIVVLANRPTAAECNQMLSFGATACISKETQGRDIINAIHLASRGMHVLPRSASSGLMDGNGLARPGPDLLTARTFDAHPTSTEIAHELSIGIETVRTHARNIYRKLGISSRRDLASLSRSTIKA